MMVGAVFVYSPAVILKIYGQSDDVDIGYLPLLYHSNIVAY